jgi:hypothetical protein
MTRGRDNFHEQPDILEGRLSAYLDGMLDANARARLEAHLADCAACRQQLAELRRVRALMRALPQPALPRSFLLPVEAPQPASSAPTPAAPTPLQAARGRRQTVTRVARAAQWLGGIAAVLGLALLISTAVLGGRGVVESTSSPAAAPSGGSTGFSSDLNNRQASPTTPRAQSGQQSTAEPTPPAKSTAGPGDTSAKSAESPHDQSGAPVQPPPLLELQLGGLALAMAGVLLLVASRVALRRRLRE